MRKPRKATLKLDDISGPPSNSKTLHVQVTPAVDLKREIDEEKANYTRTVLFKNQVIQSKQDLIKKLQEDFAFQKQKKEKKIDKQKEKIQRLAPKNIERKSQKISELEKITILREERLKLKETINEHKKLLEKAKEENELKKMEMTLSQNSNGLNVLKAEKKFLEDDARRQFEVYYQIIEQADSMINEISPVIEEVVKEAEILQRENQELYELIDRYEIEEQNLKKEIKKRSYSVKMMTADEYRRRLSEERQKYQIKNENFEKEIRNKLEENRVMVQDLERELTDRDIGISELKKRIHELEEDLSNKQKEKEERIQFLKEEHQKSIRKLRLDIKNEYELEARLLAKC